MTESTARYPFEYKVLEAATHISTRCTGDARAYVITLDHDGLVLQILFEHQEETWFEFVDSLRVKGTPHIFFSPSTLLNRIWMSWLGVSHSVLMRFFDLDLTTTDFESSVVEDGSDEMSAQTRLNTLPETWEVMFDTRQINSPISPLED